MDRDKRLLFQRTVAQDGITTGQIKSYNGARCNMGRGWDKSRMNLTYDVTS